MKPGGRPRRLTPEREAELYTAVLDLLREVGYGSLTMDAVATRTRCSKATLYRQWTGKPQLVAKALRHQKPVTLAGIDTGSLPGDFDAAATRLNPLRLERDAALFRGLAQAAHADPDLFRALRELLVVPELTGLATLLQRAVERGELPADTPAVPYVPHALLGLMVAHQLLEDGPVGPEFVRNYVDAVVLPALGV
ncbi:MULTISPECIES: TetR/AcrR family transcriptional regulator [unclassified Streptomyces]|uniref:TetR/AcrR family transcriptional regulator n=1 Tax=unclassified Streptomyces TaxID=2593676 RepID=UPI002473C0EF|nr:MULTISPECIES: TetR/AcrR family transcriptional regulator [unclassified Streptomyces]MDH6447867.1 AcrR family transcriptional regulator [Streptomyces sp. SAI-119]MDH6501410.1 AcrR family transcriptional regulator [Streptomyces sp. SAI-149]